MRRRLLLVTILVGGLALAALSPAPIAGQGQAYSPPRLADGQPDLQGTYDRATLTEARPLRRKTSARTA